MTWQMGCRNLTITLATTLAGASALATTFYPQPFPEKVQNAPVIVRGKVGMSYSDWGKDMDGSKRLYTYYELTPSESLKGDVAASGSVIVRELGGEKDGVGMHVEGTAEFSKGEDVVVFLQERNAEGSYDVSGMMMGKYGIDSDSNGQEFLTGPGLIGTPESPTTRWDLEKLRDLIKSQGAPSPQNSAAAGKPGVSAQPLRTPSPTAPQLQNQSAEEGNPSSNKVSWVVAALGVLGISGFFLVLRNRK